MPKSSSHAKAVQEAVLPFAISTSFYHLISGTQMELAAQNSPFKFDSVRGYAKFWGSNALWRSLPSSAVLRFCKEAIRSPSQICVSDYFLRNYPNANPLWIGLSAGALSTTLETPVSALTERVKGLSQQYHNTTLVNAYRTEFRTLGFVGGMQSAFRGTSWYFARTLTTVPVMYAVGFKLDAMVKSRHPKVKTFSKEDMALLMVTTTASSMCAAASSNWLEVIRFKVIRGVWDKGTVMSNLNKMIAQQGALPALRNVALLGIGWRTANCFSSSFFAGCIRRSAQREREEKVSFEPISNPSGKII